MFWELFTFLESGLLRCISVLLYFIVPLTSVFENHGLKRLYCKSRSGPGNTRGRSGYLEGFRIADGPLDFHFLKAVERILEPLGILDKSFYGND